MSKDKKYVIDNELLIKEWYYEKNNKLNIFPQKVTCGSHKEVWWKCQNGHIYQKSVKDRNNIKNGCPYCNRRCVKKGYNDLKTTDSQILQFWNYDKNNKRPEEVIFNATKKYWWKFECGHERYATSYAIKKFPRCVYCYGNKILTGYNDFATKQPKLLEEWDYEKNKLNPHKIGEFSNQYAYWICKRCKNSWKAIISSRSNGRGCPKCNSEKNTSFGEQAIFYYIKKLNIECYNRYKLDNRYEIDIFLPQSKVGIEYDGFFFHKNKKTTDKQKENEIKKRGITLYRIIEKKEKSNNVFWKDNKIIYGYDKGDNLTKAIKTLLDKLNIIYDKNFIDVKRDYSEIDKSYQKSLKERSLSSLNSEIIKEWDYEKNYPITPDTIYLSSGKKVWWKCSKCGEAYFRSPNEIMAGCKCPKCSHKRRVATLEKVLLKKNGTLFEKKPIFLKEWNYEKNNISPNEITLKSNKKVWWKCSNCEYEWQSTPYNRSQGKGCPECAKKIIGNKKSKKVYQYTLDGVYVNTYNSVTEAINLTGIKHISSACNGTRKSAGGFIWRYNKENI